MSSVSIITFLGVSLPGLVIPLATGVRVPRDFARAGAVVARAWQRLQLRQQNALDGCLICCCCCCCLSCWRCCCSGCCCCCCYCCCCCADCDVGVVACLPLRGDVSAAFVVAAAAVVAAVAVAVQHAMPDAPVVAPAMLPLQPLLLLLHLLLQLPPAFPSHCSPPHQRQHQHHRPHPGLNSAPRMRDLHGEK